MTRKVDRPWDYGPAVASETWAGQHWSLTRPPRKGEKVQQPVTRTVTLDEAGLWHCDCEAGRFRKNCAHVKHVQALMAGPVPATEKSGGGSPPRPPERERVEMSDAIKRIQEALCAPFAVEALGWKPQSISGNRALAVPYVDARDVQKRLDDVVGVDGWEDSFDVLPDGCVVCK